MIIGCTFALALWDLSLFGKDGNRNPSQPKDVLLEKLHLKALAIASGFGLLVSILSLNIHMHMSFGLIGGLLVLVALGLHLSLRFPMR